MIGDEYFPTAAEVARDRECAVDPHNWVNCETCEGSGVLCDGHPNDPDAGEVTCHDCDGSGGHEWECEECGNTVFADGYDCLACETADALPAEGFDHAAIAKGIAAALNQGVQS
jgi:hypothetical protein